MISSGQVILKRWRVDGEILSHKQIRRWLVWDLESDTEYLLLHPTASELMHSEQPHTFVNTHRLQHAAVINTHDNVPFAIYPLHNSELKRDTVYDDDIWLSILSSVLQDTSTAPLDYLEIIEGDGHISIRRLGQTHQRQRIGVNPLYHPEDKHSAAFSVAMMRCLQNTTLKWNTRADFEYWLTERHFADLLKSMSPALQNTLEVILEGTNSSSPPTLPLQNDATQLSPIAHTPQLPATVRSTTTTVESSALRVQHLPEYLLMVNGIQANSVARDISIVLDVPIQAILEQMKEAGPILLGGANSQTDAEALVSKCENIPINIEVTHRNGSFSTALLLGAGTLTTGMGLGILTLTGSLAGLIVPATTIPLLMWLRSNWASILKRKWKRFLRVGLEGSEVDVALRAARKRILLSDLPPSAINELQKSIDALAASGRSDADLIQVANTICISQPTDHVSHKADLSTLESKALQSIL